MHWWRFEFATASSSPTNVNDHVMNSKHYTENENAKYRLLWFRFEHVPTSFIRNISKTFSAHFLPVQSSLFIWCIPNPCFQQVCFFCQEYFLVFICQTFGYFSFIKTLFEESFFNDEVLKLQLPAVGLWGWGTISWRAKSTHKSNLHSADFLGLVWNRFRQFSSEIFPSLFQLAFVVDYPPRFLAVFNALSSIGVVFIC